MNPHQSITATVAAEVHPNNGSQRFKDILVVLIQKEIKSRYKSTWFGYLWSVANPLIFAAIYYIAFGIVMRVQVPNYHLFLIAGLFPWHWVVHSLNAAPSVFLSNSTLIKKVAFRKDLLVAATVVNDGVHFILTIPVILLAMLASGLWPTPAWAIGLPLLLVAQFLTIYGFALALASVNLFFRDLDRLVSVIITALFFLTPVAYSVSMIPSQYQRLIYLNPFAPLVLGWQQLFLAGTIEWECVGLASLYAMGVLALGFAVYRKLSPRFAEVV